MIVDRNLDVQKETKYTRKGNNLTKINLAPYFTPHEKKKLDMDQWFEWRVKW